MECNAHYVFWLACIYPRFGWLLCENLDEALNRANISLPAEEKAELRKILEARYTMTGREVIEAVGSLTAPDDFHAQRIGPVPPPPPPWRKILFLEHRAF
jgi:hypothetical protein